MRTPNYSCSCSLTTGHSTSTKATGLAPTRPRELQRERGTPLPLLLLLLSRLQEGRCCACLPSPLPAPRAILATPHPLPLGHTPPRPLSHVRFLMVTVFVLLRSQASWGWETSGLLSPTPFLFSGTSDGCHMGPACLPSGLLPAGWALLSKPWPHAGSSGCLAQPSLPTHGAHPGQTVAVPCPGPPCPGPVWQTFSPWP